jgi:hypothetical protein
MNTAELKKLAEAARASLSEKGTGRDTYIFRELADEEAVLELLAINAELVEALRFCKSNAGSPELVWASARAALARYEGEATSPPPVQQGKAAPPKNKGKYHSCEIPGCIVCLNPERIDDEETP